MSEELNARSGGSGEHSIGSSAPQSAEHSNGSSEPSAQNGGLYSRNSEASAGGRKDSPFSAYAVASQVGFLVIIPLLVFIWGGSWLVDRFSLPGWLMIVFVFLGIFVMIGSVTGYLYRMIRMYGGDKKPEKNSKLKHDVRDHDYYDN